MRESNTENETQTFLLLWFEKKPAGNRLTRLAIYKRGREFEHGATVKQIQVARAEDLNPGPKKLCNNYHEGGCKTEGRGRSVK